MATSRLSFMNHQTHAVDTTRGNCTTVVWHGCIAMLTDQTSIHNPCLRGSTDHCLTPAVRNNRLSTLDWPEAVEVDGSLCSWTLLTATTLWRFDAVSGSHPPQLLPARSSCRACAVAKDCRVAELRLSGNRLRGRGWPLSALLLFLVQNNQRQGDCTHEYGPGDRERARH